MRPLSNFFRRIGGAAGPPGPAAPAEVVRCRQARRGELHTALRWVLSTGGHVPDDAQLNDFLQNSARRGLDVAATWVAERRGRVLWAILPVVSPGRTVLLLAPADLPAGDALPAAGLLIDAVCDAAGQRGVRLAQVLLDPSNGAARDVYVARRFRLMAQLDYLETVFRRPLPAPPLPPGMGWVEYSPATHPLFAATILETYRDSLDCPGLNGLRDIDDVIAGHKASGEFDPATWFLLAERPPGDAAAGGAGAPPPLGVLLLSRMSRGDGFELVYLGLTPAARGRGLADLLMRQAIAVVTAAGARAAVAGGGRGKPPRDEALLPPRPLPDRRQGRNDEGIARATVPRERGVKEVISAHVP